MVSRSRAVLAALVLLSSGRASAAQDVPTAAAFPAVPKFAIDASPVALAGDVRPSQYLGVVSPRAAWLGTETGEAEIWVHPLKLVSAFRLDFLVPDYVEPVRGNNVARSVEVRPELTTITYSHATFTVRQHILAPLDEPGILVLLDVDTVRPLEIQASFRNVFQYAWPAAFGGQYARWDESVKAFLLSESLRKRNGYIGSPWATSASMQPAHALPDAPSVFRIPVDPARARREFVPIVVVAGTSPRDELMRTYRDLLARAEELYRSRLEHANGLRSAAVSIDSPDDRLDLALEWAKVNLDEQRVCNPDLGCGPVAGWGPSGQSTRPGFGWYFGGDAAINSLALSSAGLHDLVAEGLRFFAKYQRADGKITHEISQGAGQIPWFTDYPYAYYHADTTPYWIVAAWQHWRATGDTGLIDELWPNLRKAWAWCLTVETDGDGIIENTTGGLGAIEVGEIGESIHEDIYLAAVWIEATDAMQELASARGEEALAGEARALGEKARRTLNERYWLDAAGHHAFGILRSGATNDALTVWPAIAAAFSLFDGEHARRTLAALASHRLTADWGARMLATDHRLYDPLHYNMGAVWPFVTGFVAWAHYAYDRPWAAYPLVNALARLTFDWARGRHPELLSGQYYRPLDEAVPDQFFATSMLVTPLLRGLVGWTQDAPHGRARLSPSLPPSWPLLRVQQLPVGASRVQVRLEQRTNRLTTRLSTVGPPVIVEFVPRLPVGARAVSTSVYGAGAGVGTSPASAADHAPGAMDVRVGTQPVTLVTTWKGGIAVEPPRFEPMPGDISRGIRVLDVVPDGDAVRIELEAPVGSEQELRLYGARPASVDGGEIVSWQGNAGRVRVRFPEEGPAPFARKTLVVRPR